MCVMTSTVVESIITHLLELCDLYNDVSLRAADTVENRATAAASIHHEL